MIKLDEWTDEIGNISNWKIKKYPPSYDERSVKSTVFVVSAKLMLEGFDRIECGWRVDEVDLARAEFRNKPNPEESYITYIKEYFDDYLKNVAVKIGTYIAQKEKRIIIPQRPAFHPEVSQREQNAFKELLYKHKQRKKRRG